MNIIDKKFIRRAKYKTSFSLISQNEIAAANKGNLIQAKPLLKDTQTNDEKNWQIYMKLTNKKISPILSKTN